LTLPPMLPTLLVWQGCTALPSFYWLWWGLRFFAQTGLWLQSTWPLPTSQFLFQLDCLSLAGISDFPLKNRSQGYLMWQNWGRQSPWTMVADHVSQWPVHKGLISLCSLGGFIFMPCF
jgi:hypothetical protein